MGAEPATLSAVSSPTKRTPRLPPEQRRRELLDAALEVVTERGFDEVSIEAVARRAGVTRPVVYDFFGGLEGLLVALVDREEERAIGPLGPLIDELSRDEADVADVLHDGVLGFLQVVHERPRTWRLMLTPPATTSPLLRSRIAGQRQLLAGRLTALVGWSMETRDELGGVDEQLIARLLVPVAEDTARLSLLYPDRYPPERVAVAARGLMALIGRGADGRRTPLPAAATIFSARVPRDEAPPSSGPGTRMPRAARRRQLLDLSLDLLVERGFGALSIDAIARLARVNRNVVYRIFPSLDQLLETLLDREGVRLRRLMDATIPTDLDGRDAPEVMIGVLAGFLSTALEHPKTYRLALQRPESTPAALRKIVNRQRADIIARLEPLVAWAVAQLGFPPEHADVDLYARLLLSASEELARLALDDPDYPPDRLLRGVWDVICLLRPAPGAPR